MRLRVDVWWLEFARFRARFNIHHQGNYWGWSECSYEIHLSAGCISRRTISGSRKNKECRKHFTSLANFWMADMGGCDKAKFPRVTQKLGAGMMAAQNGRMDKNSSRGSECSRKLWGVEIRRGKI
ncbi:hypothetical protein Zmor_000241 [Zophobas morio]|uniref:Uncharacterized protein n=1 Tax=Zophobas morio TaxID=2755281 RepID=A0AA38J289_9CUCU|nr:hypothetical protein Zmor_000241 [Zophobas morio]